MKPPCRRVVLFVFLAFFVFGLLNLIVLDRSDLQNEQPPPPSTPVIEGVEINFRALGQDFYVYSAYMDESFVIKIIGMRRSVPERDQIFCSTGANGLSKVEASIYEVPEKRRAIFYVAIIITCDFRSAIEKKVAATLKSKFCIFPWEPELIAFFCSLN